MVDVSSAVLWWEDWQLRILVLGSLFLQFFLFFSSMVRNCPISSLCRSLMWLAYIGSDAVAIYALATLFNRHKLSGIAESSKALEVLWAPILLIHLGGQHSFTAYSLEDNELWIRHVMTMVSQVTVAIYVFCKSWHVGGDIDKRLLRAAILLFIVGILKFIRKPWTLKSASLSSVVTSPAVYPQRRGPLEHVCDMLCLPFESTFTSFDDAAAMKEEEENDVSLEEYVAKAKELVRVTEIAGGEGKLENSADVNRLFVDLSAPYRRRLSKLKYFLKLNMSESLLDLQYDLAYAFSLIYTNLNGAVSCPGLLLQLLLPFLVLASAVLFARSHRKDDYPENDVKVTTVLFLCTTLLEFLPFLFSPCCIGSCIWSSTVAQHNLVAYYRRKRNPTKFMMLSAILGCKGYSNKHMYIEQVSQKGCMEIINLVTEHVKGGWNQYICDAQSYRRFNNFRGQWTVSRHKVCGDQMRWSLQAPFDQSVLVWHLATELCLYHPRTTATAYDKLPAARCSRLISRYMIYLLLIRPEMLMPGSRQGLFTASCDDIELMLKRRRGNEPSSQDVRTIAEQILDAAQSPSTNVGTLIPRACNLAKELMELLDDEEQRWKVIQGVWVEMLCCSAGRCRGYLHARSMGEGVEFLSVVWLLLSRLGMETFADKFQRPEPGENQVFAAGPSSSSSKAQDVPASEEISVV
ncbi:hypothetical protein PR202_ga16634 [Eleusine coracana subsp. coracana]|uniref:DUF4220 domain-containing protein n=1 Tax=Eleusine coracana subsp. coracana TaxID=191504 RepID=A0AAV5CND0_ELECO|nr:hypothetical protein PR202_ga16634 [Eleusine coracana subsp. coracana]